MKTNYSIKTEFNAQSGIALITVMVVLFVLTLLGIAATDSSNFQALMVRNNQFRLETFNASRAQIQNQLAALNQVPVAGAPAVAPGVVIGNDGLPAAPGVIAVANNASATALFFAINSGGRVSTEDGSNAGVFDVLFPLGAQPTITQQVAFQRVEGCPIVGESIGEGAAGSNLECHKIQVDTDALLTNTSVQSLQSQTFSFISF